MARKQESREFKVSPSGEGTDDETVGIMITALDGNTAGEIGIRLLQIFGPSIVGVVASMESNDLQKVAEQATQFFAKLTPAEFKSLTKALFRGAQVQELGEFKNLDDSFINERFAGHVGSLMALTVFALKVNFSNFFADLGLSKERLAQLMPKAQERAKKVMATV